MGIFSKKENRADSLVSESDTLGQRISAELIRAIFGVEEISREQALEIPTVNACIWKIASTISALPIKLYKQEGDKVVEIKGDSRLYLLNHDTRDTLTATQFWRAMLEDYFLGKGAYAYIYKFYTEYKSLHYIENDHISFLTNTDPIFKDYDICVQGTRKSKDDFLKILRKTKDGHKSVSLQSENKTFLSVAYNTLRFENNLVRKGGNKKGFIKTPKTLDDDAKTKLREAFKKLYANNEENVVVLSGGAEFQESSNSCVEMQLNENKESNASQICQLFGMPVTILLGKANKSDKDEYLESCITPILNDIEASLDRDMLTEEEKEQDFFYAFDTKELKRGNIKERYEAYQIAYQNNFLQIDEIRNMEDLEPLGFEFIKLGLDSVLYNPKTKEIYTPNTNESRKLNMNMKGGNADEGGSES